MSVKCFKCQKEQTTNPDTIFLAVPLYPPPGDNVANQDQHTQIVACVDCVRFESDNDRLKLVETLNRLRELGFPKENSDAV